jgi:hypothetical protein
VNSALADMADNSWLNPQPEGTAFARMYSGCCAGGGYLWYFGGAHRADKGNDIHLFVNDVRRDRQQLFDGGVTETWAYRYRNSRKHRK